MAVKEAVLFLLIILVSTVPVAPQGCDKALGMESGAISCKQISASSYQADHDAERGRLHFEVTPGQVGSWSSRRSNHQQWLQIDLGSSTNVTRVATQGGTDFRDNDRWVRKYRVQYSDDGVNFQTYMEQGREKVFDGNTNSYGVVDRVLSPPIIATRYIRFQPTDWSRRGISMRVELYGCQEIKACDSSPCLNGGICSEEKGGDYSCKCSNKWTGKRCDVFNAMGLKQSVIVGNNKGHLASLNKFLKPVAQSGHHWEICWRASRDGWEAKRFHDLCDGKGPTVTIIKVNQYIFGGYTSTSWSSSCHNQHDSKPFIFSLVNKPGWGPVKLPPPGNQLSYSYDNAIYGCSTNGPSFGTDIYIGDQAGLSTTSISNLGTTYGGPSGNEYPSSTFSQTFLAGTFRFRTDEIEVFYETP